MENNTFYLDEDILITFEYESAGIDRTGEYFIYKYLPNTTTPSFETTPSYKGEVFLGADTTSVTIYLNDVLYSYHKTPDVLNGDSTGVFNFYDNYNKYKIVLRESLASLSLEEYVYVILSNRYPSLDKRTLCITSSGNEIPNYSDDSNKVGADMIREGYNAVTDKSTLYPRIPNGMVFGALVNFGGGYFAKHGGYIGTSVGYRYYNYYPTSWGSVNITKDNKSFNYLLFKANVSNPDPSKNYECDIYPFVKWQGYSTLWLLSVKSGWTKENAVNYLYTYLGEYFVREDLEWLFDSVNTDKRKEDVATSRDMSYINTLNAAFSSVFNTSIEDAYQSYPIKVADIDLCPAKYYVLWYDRYGGLQCQPFEGNTVVSTNNKRGVIKNTLGKERMGSNTVTTKWKLCSGWISDNEYPIYESILTSPSVILYDTENNVKHGVLVTNKDYTEKTYKNQGNKLNNFELEVEKNTVQRMFY